MILSQSKLSLWFPVGPFTIKMYTLMAHSGALDTGERKLYTVFFFATHWSYIYCHSLPSLWMFRRCSSSLIVGDRINTSITKTTKNSKNKGNITYFQMSKEISGRLSLKCLSDMESQLILLYNNLKPYSLMSTDMCTENNYIIKLWSKKRSEIKVLPSNPQWWPKQSK